MGAGITGAYLYRLLRNRACRVDIFDRGPRTRCGINPCAWGTSRGFDELVSASGLDPSGYILNHVDYLLMDGLRIRADLMTFDKRRLIKDLLAGAEVNRSQPDMAAYDRIIDATGVERAFLPPIFDDIILSCVQYRIRTDEDIENKIKLGKIGYGWSFPLQPHEYHVGCGCLLADARQVLKDLGWVRSDNPCRMKTLCACTGRIRLTGPHHSGPFFSNHTAKEVWGVGEAIGCVAPLAGDGIVTGMRSVQILLDWWHDPVGYERAILKEFKWMEGERKVVDKLRRNDALAATDAWVLRENSKRMGMEVGLRAAATLLKKLR